MIAEKGQDARGGKKAVCLGAGQGGYGQPPGTTKKGGKGNYCVVTTCKIPKSYFTNAIIILEMGVLWVSYPLRYRFRSVTLPETFRVF